MSEPAASVFPYFSGQKVCPCGHYYPDVLVSHTFPAPDGGKPYMVCDCVSCGVYKSYCPTHGFVRLDGTEVLTPTSAGEDLATFRSAERLRLSSPGG